MLETKVLRFFEGLSTRLETLEELRSVYDEQMAFNFNATRFFWPGENTTSEILAFLLNPLSNHGQKDAFLRVFCKTLLGENRDWNALIGTDVRVGREQYTDHDRRIDIVVSIGRGREKFLVGIENKIWAADQKAQLRDYSAFLEGQSPDNYCLLYLTPRGHDPSEYSITQDERSELEEAGKLKIISYEEDIIDLFDQFIMVCKADKVTAFLRDFQHYLRIQYTGVWNMDDGKTIKEFITRSAENIELALQVAGSISAVEEPLYKRLQDELREWVQSDSRANPPDLCFHSLQDAAARRPATEWGELIKLRHKDWVLSLDFQAKRLGSPAVIIRGVKEGPVDLALLEGIKGTLGYPNTNSSAPNIHRYPGEYQGHWDTNLAPWLDMAARSEDPKYKTYSKFTKKIIGWHDSASDAIKRALASNGREPNADAGSANA
jgi:hypothetical protein